MTGRYTDNMTQVMGTLYQNQKAFDTKIIIVRNNNVNHKFN